MKPSNTRSRTSATASAACSSCATASAASTRTPSRRSGARSTSRASASAKSNTTRSRSSRTSPKPKSCTTTSRSLPIGAEHAQAPNLDARRGDLGSRGWARHRRGGTVAQPANQIAPTRSSTGLMASIADRAAEQHRAKLREIQRHLEARSLTVRKMTAEERKRYPPRPPKPRRP